VTTMIGAGIVGFPKTFSRGGWVLSPVLLLMCTWVVVEMGSIINATLKMCEEQAKKGFLFSFGVKPEKYEDMLEVPFGKVGKTAACICCNSFLLMVGGAFMILIGQSIEYIVCDKVAYRVCVLGISLVFAPLSLLNDMTWINRLSVLGVIASIMYVVAIAHAGLSAGGVGLKGDIQYGPETPGDIGKIISVMLLGFTYQMVAPTLRSEMQAPQEFPKALNWSIFLVAIVYMLAGVTGFYGWGAAVEGNVLKSMLHDNKPIFAGYMLASAVIANLCVTFPIIMNVACVAFERIVIGEGAYSKTLRLGLFGISFVVGFFCPYFLEFLGIVSALLGVTVGILMPMAAYWALLLEKDSDTKESRYVEGAKHFFIAVIAAITLVNGSIAGIEDLFNAVAQNGSYWESFWKPSSWRPEHLATLISTTAHP